jgi:hypothetical protein
MKGRFKFEVVETGKFTKSGKPVILHKLKWPVGWRNRGVLFDTELAVRLVKRLMEKHHFPKPKAVARVAEKLDLTEEQVGKAFDSPSGGLGRYRHPKREQPAKPMSPELKELMRKLYTTGHNGWPDGYDRDAETDKWLLEEPRKKGPNLYKPKVSLKD